MSGRDADSLTDGELQLQHGIDIDDVASARTAHTTFIPFCMLSILYSMHTVLYASNFEFEYLIIRA
jgi:hypothetical protein